MGFSSHSLHAECLSYIYTMNKEHAITVTISAITITGLESETMYMSEVRSTILVTFM